MILYHQIGLRAQECQVLYEDLCGGDRPVLQSWIQTGAAAATPTPVRL
jgi:hypothetical protein